MNIKQHPHYHEGFFDALDGEPIFDDATSEYRAGWEAAWESKRIFEKAGFKKNGRDFSISGPVAE